MKMIFKLAGPTAAYVFLAALVAGGCGGSGAGSLSKLGSGSVSNPSAPSATPGTTAHFHVDVNTGKVTIANGLAKSNSRAILSGTSVAFNSSTLFNSTNSADAGTRILNVSLTNNSGLELGSPNGLNVEFSNFANVGSFPDVRSLTTVSTVATGFMNPYGVVAAGNGTFYVADTFHNQIKMVSDGNVSLLAGSGVKGEVDGPASAAQFNLPVGIALYKGNLVVADFGGNKIRQVSLSGQVTTLASSTTFNGPWGVATDGLSNIYVCEKTAADIKDISNGSVTVLAGGTAGNADGLGSAAKFYNPEGIAFVNGFLYVADNGNNSVRQIIASTGAVVTIAGTGAGGYTDGIGNVATLSQPAGVTFINGSVIISETGSGGVNLRQITPIQGTSGSNSTSWQTSTIAGNGSAGYADGTGSNAQFNNPNLISSDASGNVYVADINNNAIREVIPSNGVFPIGVPTGATPSAELVQISNPTNLQDSASGTQTFPFINYPGSLESGQTSAVQPWWFTVPPGVNAFEFDVTVQADTSGLLSPGGATNVGDPTEIVSTLAGSIQNQGYLSGSTSQARFGTNLYTLPTSLGLFVSDYYQGTISLIVPSGQVFHIAGGPNRTVADGTGDLAGLYRPASMVQDSNGNIYVADYNTVRILTVNGGSPTVASNWYVTTIAGGQSIGLVNGLGNVATFGSLTGLAIDSTGNLFASDILYHNIRLLAPNGGYVGSSTSWNVSLFAGSSTGASGFVNGTGSAAEFYYPYSVAIDPSGNLYVDDFQNTAIRKVTRDGVVSTVISKNGYADGPLASAYIHYPTYVSSDSAGYIYFADSYESGYVEGRGTTMVRKISPGGIVSTVAGSTIQGTVDGPGNLARFYLITSISVAPNGDIYVGDGSSVRVIQKQISVGANARKQAR